MASKKILAVIGATGAQGGGLARSILADPAGEFAVRAITRKPDSERARALAAAGAEIVVADADEPATLERAFAGAYGAFCVTNFWEHLSPEREYEQATALARATAGLEHVVWSTLEDTRKWIPVEDPRLPTLREKYTVPHFDAKGEADAVFEAEPAPTTFLLPAFYWENFIYFGAGPRPDADGELVLALPLGGTPLPGIAVEDIGRCAHGIFRRGPGRNGERFGIAGEVLSGEQLAAKMARALGRPVRFQEVPFDAYRAAGWPGADDMGNMFEFQAILGDEFLRARDVEVARSLNPKLQSFDQWLAANAGRIPVG
ncbi:MAG TPA: NmrA/HSCARG family protein [Thermoanaerobaculia bacterium]|nr:NmrA/HSCARG family protein [Thermoanaerobaculia bacterium]